MVMWLSTSKSAEIPQISFSFLFTLPLLLRYDELQDLLNSWEQDEFPATPPGMVVVVPPTRCLAREANKGHF